MVLIPSSWNEISAGSITQLNSKSVKSCPYITLIKDSAEADIVSREQPPMQLMGLISTSCNSMIEITAGIAESSSSAPYYTLREIVMTSPEIKWLFGIVSSDSLVGVPYNELEGS